MRRILLIVAYDGTEYHGWQIQENGNTIEGELNRAIFKLTGEVIEVIGASRTDAGVHGLCNRAVFDTASTIPAERFCVALNTYLPNDIRVISSKQVADDWHPRKCATHKTYEYRIDCGDTENPLISRYAWHIRSRLNIENMKKGASFLVGEHDFTSFCSVKGKALSNVREIIKCEVICKRRTLYGIGGEDRAVEKSVSTNAGKEFAYENIGKESIGSDKGKKPVLDNAGNSLLDNDGKLVSGEIVIRITGNGFLYNMVRIITGTLVQVGMGKFTPEDIKKMIEAEDRCTAGQTAPPMGLTLVKIEDVKSGDIYIRDSEGEYSVAGQRYEAGKTYSFGFEVD